MFDGNKQCTLCKKEVEGKDRKFGISLRGYSHVFCTSCAETKKDQVKHILHDEK